MPRSLTSMSIADPFVLDGLLDIPDLVSEPKPIWHLFQQASGLFPPNFILAEKEEETLPELRAEFFALHSYDESLPELDSLAESTSTSETVEAASNEELVRNDEELEYLWSLGDVINGTRENKLVNWDTFLSPQSETPRSAYLSEAGLACFDALLANKASQANKKLPKLVAQHGDFLRSLYELGMGRDSILYHYDRSLARFVPTTEDFGLSGISFEVQQELLQSFLRAGNCVRQLEEFVGEPKTSPLSIAMSSAISTVLYAIKAELQTSNSKIRSILQIQDLLSRPDCLVQSLQHLIKITTTSDSSENTIIKLAHKSENLSCHYGWQAELLQEILQRVSAPWISMIEAGVGLRRDPTGSELRTLLSPKFNGAEEETPDSSQETPLTPVEALVTESRRCLVILRAQQSDHPILKSSGTSLPALSWQTSWEAILRIQDQANDYEQALQRAIVEYSYGASTEVRHPRRNDVDDLSQNEEEVPTLINLDAPVVLDRDLGGQSSLSDSRLFQVTTTVLSGNVEYSKSPAHAEICPPPSQSLSLSLMPLLNAQSRLLSFSTLHLLFKTHSLRTHLSLQYRFQLLSDGAFASRLSRALFDPDQTTGEGRRTTEGTTGLRLQARDTWPPASSELRLVLMGILSESYHTAADPRSSNSDNLPGNLSFAIRDLSTEELEKCRNVSNVEALDFLRLQYKAPPVLDSVITESSLRKYDKIFKYMLRLLRIQAVAQSLLREVACRNGEIDRRSQRFRIDIQHFVTTLAAYSSNDAIAMEWSRFRELLDRIEAAIGQGDYEGTLAKAGSLSHVEQLHEDVLDRMIRALFLGRRQAQVRDVVDGVFGLILRFAGICRRGHGKETTNETQQMHTDFKRQINRFVRYLQSQAPASAARSYASEDGSQAPFEHLLLQLDMVGYST